MFDFNNGDEIPTESQVQEFSTFDLTRLIADLRNFIYGDSEDKAKKARAQRLVYTLVSPHTPNYGMYYDTKFRESSDAVREQRNAEKMRQKQKHLQEAASTQLKINTMRNTGNVGPAGITPNYSKEKADLAMQQGSPTQVKNKDSVQVALSAIANGTDLHNQEGYTMLTSAYEEANNTGDLVNRDKIGATIDAIFSDTDHVNWGSK